MNLENLSIVAASMFAGFLLAFVLELSWLSRLAHARERETRKWNELVREAEAAERFWALEDAVDALRRLQEDAYGD